MRLALRFLVATIVPVALVIMGNGYLRVQREVRLFEEEIAVHQRAMGRALAASVEHIWATGGPDAAQRLIETADRRDNLLRLQWRPDADIHDVNVRAVVGRGEVFVRTTEGDDQAVQSIVPVFFQKTLVGVLILDEPLDREASYLSATVLRVVVNTVLAVFLISAVMGTLGWWLVGRRVSALHALVRQVGRKQGSLNITSVAQQRDELSDLARELQVTHRTLLQARQERDAEIEQRLQTVQQLRHADRLTSIGQLASGMAHEIGTPLNVVLGRARMLQRPNVPDEKRLAYLDVIVRQTERISALIASVLGFARQGEPTVQATPLKTLAEDTVTLLQPIAKKKGVELSVTGKKLEADVDRLALNQVITNLVMNAIQACDHGDHVVVEVQPAAHQASGAHSMLQLVVADTGPGMNDDVLRRAFDPFFTTKDIGEGTGLGLSVTHGIVRDHGGEIVVDSEVGRGTRFTITLPRSRRDA